jgi:hypothetical protein
LRNYWVAAGVMAGVCQGGGVGRCIAEWMIDGEPSIDVGGMDVARFVEFATFDYGTQRAMENYSRRFLISYPNEELPATRPLKSTALYDRFKKRGALFGVNFGLEHALWFAPSESEAAARAENARGPEKRLVTLVVDADEVDTHRDEPIFCDGNCVGYVTSGGYAHYVKKSVAMGYVPAALATQGCHAQYPDRHAFCIHASARRRALAGRSPEGNRIEQFAPKNLSPRDQHRMAVLLGPGARESGVECGIGPESRASNHESLTSADK